MNKHFIAAEPRLRQIVDNPGKTVEELQEQVKTLASIITSVTKFIDGDLAEQIMNDLETKERLRSS